MMAIPLTQIRCIQATTCECGWETVHVLPEEELFLRRALEGHIRDHHKPGENPVFTAQVWR